MVYLLYNAKDKKGKLIIKLVSFGKMAYKIAKIKETIIDARLMFSQIYFDVSMK